MRRVVAPAELPAGTAKISFTSGSTGQPKANAKTWGGFHASNARNLALVRSLLSEGGFDPLAPAAIIEETAIRFSFMLP